MVVVAGSPNIGQMGDFHVISRPDRGAARSWSADRIAAMDTNVPVWEA
jgi:hypothetical protein